MAPILRFVEVEAPRVMFPLFVIFPLLIAYTPTFPVPLVKVISPTLFTVPAENIPKFEPLLPVEVIFVLLVIFPAVSLE